MSKYQAWLNGQGVALGTLAGVRERAMAIYRSADYQEHIASKGPVTLRITRGARQSFVESRILHSATDASES